VKQPARFALIFTPTILMLVGKPTTRQQAKNSSLWNQIKQFPGFQMEISISFALIFILTILILVVKELRVTIPQHQPKTVRQALGTSYKKHLICLFVKIAAYFVLIYTLVNPTLLVVRRRVIILQ